MATRAVILAAMHADIQRRGKTTANEIAYKTDSTVREVFAVARRNGFVVSRNTADANRTSTILPPSA